MLLNLEEAKNIMLGGRLMIQVLFCETKEGIIAKSSKIDRNAFLEACDAMDNEISAQD